MENKAVSPIRTVLVDDSDDVRALLRHALEREPEFDVVAEAGDGASGVTAVAAHKPHLVLLDVAMPVMDGLQALTLIREESPGSIVVVLSSFTETSGAPERALSMGAHAYVEKGSGIPQLIADLRRALTQEFDLLADEA